MDLAESNMKQNQTKVNFIEFIYDQKFLNSCVSVIFKFNKLSKRYNPEWLIFYVEELNIYAAKY